MNVHFQYKELNEGLLLEVSTLNPKHDTLFLLGNFEGCTKINCLEESLDGNISYILYILLILVK